MHCSLDEQVASIAADQHGMFSTANLAALGASPDQRRQRLTSGRWVERYEGVYAIAGVPRSWLGDLMAACLAGGEGALASKRSAAALWGIPGGRRDLLEITCHRWRRSREAGLVVHESTLLDPEDATVRWRIPVTTIERTLFDVAGVVGPVTLDLAIDNALRRELTGLGALDETRDRLARRGRPGSQAFTHALRERTPDTALSESARERLVFRLLRKHGFPPPVPQYEIRDLQGNFVARADFAYPELKIAIEYDSYEHHTGKQALIRDSARRNAVVALGWAPIVVTAIDLRRGGDQLADALRRSRNHRLDDLAS